MASIPFLSGEVVKGETLAEAMASGIVGGFATPLIQSHIPQIGGSFAPLVSDGIQIAIGKFTGNAIGGTAGRIVQNALVYGAANHLGMCIAGMIMGGGGGGGDGGEF